MTLVVGLMPCARFFKVRAAELHFCLRLERPYYIVIFRAGF